MAAEIQFGNFRFLIGIFPNKQYMHNHFTEDSKHHGAPQFLHSSFRSYIHMYMYHVLPVIYGVSQEECARLREGVPYVKVYRYNPKNLCPELNGYGDNGQRKVWSPGGSTHCTCQLTSLIDVYPWVWCPITESQLALAYSRLRPECAVSHVTSVLAFMCHV